MKQQLINKYDSEFCGSLPIHLINVIQPYGALLVVAKDSKEIIQVSENISELFDAPFKESVGRNIFDLITGLQFSDSKDNVPQVCEIKGNKYLAIIHSKENYCLVEINLDSTEEALDASFIDVYKELKSAINSIEESKTLLDAVEKAAIELKKASGFDKVMIYRFDSDWNGHVLAEESEYDMESYMGFTFPASDIPKQARDLYLKNAYRFIPDRNFQPVKLYPVINPLATTFVDMSDCNVRGVSTVHLEYLKNMNVTASMSTRIIKDGKLWGLIACHHKTPKRVNYKMCAVFELLSGIISAKISALENNETHAINSRLTEVYTELVEITYRSNDITDSLLMKNKSILDLFDASGAVVIYKGHISGKGAVPGNHEIEDILLWLHAKQPKKVYATDCLSDQFDYAADFKDIASGMMAIPVNTAKEEYILLFRPEITKVVNWGGNPSTRINFEADMRTYHPRFSFKLWQEKVNGISKPWKKEEIEVAENLREFLQGFWNGN